MVDVVKPVKVSIFVNEKGLSINDVKKQVGCTHIMNAGFFYGTKPVYHLRVNGKTLASDGWKRWGYGWSENDLKMIHSDYITNCSNYISAETLVFNGKPEPLMYPSDVGGFRQRTAIGLYPDGRMWLYCATNARTPEDIQKIALGLGLDSCIMLDGGLSTQGIFPNKTVIGGRIVNNFICIWAETIKEETQKMKICIDPGHGGKENYNASPDLSYYEHEFTLDMGQRLKTILEPNMETILTRSSDIFVSLADRALIANTEEADAFISIHTNATADEGWIDTRGLCIYIYAASGEREELAKALIAQFKEAGIELLGTQIYYRKTLTVLANTTMPAVLIEYGFHTNKDDVALLKTAAYRDKLAVATARGICSYYDVKMPEWPVNELGALDYINLAINAGIEIPELLRVIADKI